MLLESRISESDWRFIHAQEKWGITGLAQNFRDALEIPEDSVQDWTINKLSNVIRHGHLFNIYIAPDDAESVSQHVKDLTEFAKLAIAEDDPDLDRVLRMLQVHDDIEAIAHQRLVHRGKEVRVDINRYHLYPNGKISGEDKARIEEIAAHIVYAGRPEDLELFEEFEHGQSRAAQMAGILDRLQVLKMANKYAEMGYTPDAMSRFWQEAWDSREQERKIGEFERSVYDRLIKPDREKAEMIAFCQRVSRSYDNLLLSNLL